MKNYTTGVFIILLMLVLTACTSSSQKKDLPHKNSGPGYFGKIDSAEILYYKDPYGDDSLRYSRFFSFVTLTDPKRIDVIGKVLTDSPYVIKKEIENCRSQGKIILHLSDEVFKTVYFSAKCENDSCCYLYYIKDGQFIHYKLPGNVKSLLHDMRSSAIEPAAVTN